MEVGEQPCKSWFLIDRVSKTPFLRMMLISRIGSVELDSISQVNLILGC